MAENRKILAIDDNAVQLNIFKTILTPKYSLYTANSASHALNFLNNNKIDAILLDIEMPNISGFDFLYDIRKIPSYTKVPIIIVSGKTGQDFFDQAKNSSAFDVLTKPVIPETLIQTIEKALVTKT